MANSRYSNVRPSTVDPTDIEILYTYSPDRETPSNGNVGYLTPASQYLVPYYNPNNSSELLGGLYNLTLPSTVFNQVGIYTLIIRPKQIRTTILDCGVLSALPNQKGIVLNLNGAVDNQGNTVDLSTLVNDFAGYRIEYLNVNNGQQTLSQNFFTIITSANLCQAVSNVSSVTQKGTTYNLNSSGNLIYLSVSPQASSPTNPNSKPYIGDPGQPIIITNTNFNPQTIEINLTNYDIDSLANGIFGAQIRNVASGEITYYNPDLSIANQVLMYEIQDQFGNPLYEVKQPKTQIDTSQDFNAITANVGS